MACYTAGCFTPKSKKTLITSDTKNTRLMLIGTAGFKINQAYYVTDLNWP